MGAVREDALECMRTMCNEREIAVNRTLNSVSFKCLQLMGEGFKVCIADMVLNVDKVCSSISDFVNEAAEDGIKMSSCRYKNHSFTLDFSVNNIKLFDELMLEIIYGDSIKRTTERLNNEWLKKMWKASDDDFLVFRLEQVHRKLKGCDDQNGLWRKI